MNNQNEFLWNKCEVEEIEIRGSKTSNNVYEPYTVKALSFWFENGKVSIYKEIRPENLRHFEKPYNGWSVSAWNNTGMILFTKRLEGMLHEASSKKSIELKSVLNASKIARKNAPEMIIEMGSVMFEKVDEIEVSYPFIEERVKKEKEGEKRFREHIIKVKEDLALIQK